MALYKKHKIRYPDDCARLQRLINELGYEFSLREAEDFWEWYSEHYYCASWLHLPEKDEDIKRIFEENVFE